MQNTFWIRLENPIGLAVIDLTNYYRKGLIITRINVPFEHRRKGIGTLLLNRCCKAADTSNVKLFLEIASYGEMDKEALENWYRSYGFKPLRRCPSLFIRRPLEKESRMGKRRC